MKRRMMFVALAVAVLPAGLQAADNRVGTWKYNEAKSKFDPGPAPYKSRPHPRRRGHQGFR